MSWSVSATETVLVSEQTQFELRMPEGETYNAVQGPCPRALGCERGALPPVKRAGWAVASSSSGSRSGLGYQKFARYAQAARSGRGRSCATSSCSSIRSRRGKHSPGASRAWRMRGFAVGGIASFALPLGAGPSTSMLSWPSSGGGPLDLEEDAMGLGLVRW